jgi:hypothetical protein
MRLHLHTLAVQVFPVWQSLVTAQVSPVRWARTAAKDKNAE